MLPHYFIISIRASVINATGFGDPLMLSLPPSWGFWLLGKRLNNY